MMTIWFWFLHSKEGQWNIWTSFLASTDKNFQRKKENTLNALESQVTLQQTQPES